MPVIPADAASRHACPWNEFKPCKGPACMAWAWHGPSFEHSETNNLRETPDGPRPSGEAPPAPAGDGWEPQGMEFEKGYHQSAKLGLPKARAQRWFRRVERVQGHCQRAGHGDCGSLF